jgi:hypothetical protein
MLLFHEMADSHQKGTQTSPSIRNAAFLFFYIRLVLHRAV